MYKATDFPFYTASVKQPAGTIFRLDEGPWHALGIGAPIPVRYNGVTLPSVAHALEYARCANSHDATLVAVTPLRRLTATVTDRRPRWDWEEVKYSVLWEALTSKFAKSEHAEGVLAASKGRRILYLNRDRAADWLGMDRTESWTRSSFVGRNVLGRMLECLRDKSPMSESLPKNRKE